MELYKYFRSSDYPHKMIENILEKVKDLPRTLTHNKQDEQPNQKVVNSISTYGQNNYNPNTSQKQHHYKI